MVCPKCGNNNVNVQMVTETQLKNKHHGIFWWLLLGWWWIPVKWLLFTVPALIFKIFAPKRKKVVSTHKKMCVCQNCGYSWETK